MKNSFYQKRTKSQALIEMALMSTVLLLVLAAVTDIGYSIYRSQVIASAAREGAKSASAATDDDEALFRGITSARTVSERALGTNEFFTNGGIIVTALIRYTTSATVFSVATNTNATIGIDGKLIRNFGQMGTGGTNIYLNSKLANNSEKTTNSVTRTGDAIPPGLATNSPDNKKIYCVEVFWTNGNRGILKLLPPMTYDKAFFIYP